MIKDPNSMCLFIGIPVSMRTLRAVAGAAALIKERSRADGKTDWRWVAPARYHVTLCYLGWTKAEVVPAIRDQVAQAIAGHKRFEMRCRELGAFPSVETAQVLWAGIDDSRGELASLVGKLGPAMEKIGFPVDTRPFRPHVTMARQETGTDISKLIQEVPAHVFSKTSVEDVLLYKSSVESKTSEYEKIASWTLA